MFAFAVGSRTVKDIIDAAKPDDIFKLVLNGGRGSGSDRNWSGKFGHANEGSGNGEDKTWHDFPARMNSAKRDGATRFRSEDEALRQFRAKHANDDYESLVSVDKDGYVTHYVHGNTHSVQVAMNAGDIVYHNHPSGGNFSDMDLINTAATSARGIVASGSRGDYKFTKTNHFKAADFTKAVRNATLKGKDHNDAVDKWLTRNQKRYGYKYSFTKA